MDPKTMAVLHQMDEQIRKSLERVSEEERQEVLRDAAEMWRQILRYNGPMDPEFLDDSGRYRWDLAEKRAQRWLAEDVRCFYQKWSERLGLDVPN